MTKMRKFYMICFVFRCLVFAACVPILVFKPSELDILQNGNFFNGFSVFHILWGIWVLGILFQLIPIRKAPIGTQKLFKQRFTAAKNKFDRKALRDYIVSTTKEAYKVMLLWIGFLLILGISRYADMINDHFLFLITLVLYVCDLVCVLFWCPFRLFLKTRCCTTCRIYNWDRFFMFTPLMFIKGFFPLSLVALSVLSLIIWEISAFVHSERFWEISNEALRCSNCTDKLCSQYCKKIQE